METSIMTYYSGSHTRGGRTEPTRKRRGVSAKASAKHIEDLCNQIKIYTDLLADTVRNEDDDFYCQLYAWIAGCERAIAAHEENIAQSR